VPGDFGGNDCCFGRLLSSVQEGPLMNIFSISSLGGFIACEALAAYTYLKNPASKVNRSFAIETVFIGLWTLFPFVTWAASSGSQAVLYTRTIYLAAILVPPTFVLFVLNLLEIAHRPTEQKSLMLFYAATLVFLIFSFSRWFIVDIRPLGKTFAIVPGMVYHIFFGYFALTITYGYIRIINEYRRATGYSRNRLRYILFAFIIAGVSGFIHFMAAYGVKEIFPHDFLVIFFTALITYSIVKYNALDAKFVIKRTMAYSLSAGVLMAAFILMVMTITRFYSSYANVDSFRISLIAAFIIALLFNPLRTRLQRIIDKTFYKRTYNYYATLKKVSQKLATTFDIDEIVGFVTNTIGDTLGLRYISILAALQAGSFVVVHEKRGGGRGRKGAADTGSLMSGQSLPEDSASVAFFRRSDSILIREDIVRLEGELGRDVVKKIIEELTEFRCEAALPVFTDGKLSFILMLGEKLSGDMFTTEDISLLGTIADQMSIAVKNARMYSEKVRTERLASIGMMSATFAHEIRNPLTSLKTFAQLMPEKYNDEEFRTTFSKIVEGEIEKIDDLIKDLLDFSSGSKSARVNSLNLVSLVDETVEYVRNKLALEQREIRVERVYEQKDVHIMGDASTLKQAFINIISNGCQAMNGNGELRVEVRPNMNKVDVSITDNGEGIPPERISNIFDPFVTSKERGMGLGLAISKRVIEEHNGNIKVTSRLNEGSTFTVSLPLQNGI
jgi:signal transduction histidine kinase